MYKTILFTKQANHLGRGFSEPPAVMVRPGQLKIAEIDTPLHSEIRSFIAALRPDQNSTYVLVNAMGAGEWYGDNINGDYFPYEMLVRSSDQWKGLPVDDLQNRRQEAQRLGWGYTTFVNAHPFKHHVNKDPARSFGEVVCSVWNEKMKRVELIIRLDHALCKKNGAMDILEKIHNGEFPDVSMGCKVPYDVCSICGNKARTKEEYCEHIRNRRLNRDPRGDGQRPYMINIRPRFFDISFVFIGADKTARTLMKIASIENPVFDHIAHDVHSQYPHLSELEIDKVASDLYAGNYDPYNNEQQEMLEKAASCYIEANEKLAGVGVALRVLRSSASTPREEKYRRVRTKLRRVKESGMKLADIIKYVVPNPEAKRVSKIEGGEPDIPEQTLDRLGEGGLSAAINSTARKGIVLKAPEFARIALISAGLKGVADKLRGISPAPVDKIDMPCDCGISSCGREMDGMLSPLMRSRSLFPPVITRREIHIIIAKPEEGVKESSVQELPVLRNELMDKISAAYNGYRLWLLANAEELGYFDKEAHISLAQGFGSSFEPVSEDSLELASAYLEQAHWQARGLLA